MTLYVYSDNPEALSTLICLTGSCGFFLPGFVIEKVVTTTVTTTTHREPGIFRAALLPSLKLDTLPEMFFLSNAKAKEIYFCGQCSSLEQRKIEHPDKKCKLKQKKMAAVASTGSFLPTTFPQEAEDAGTCHRQKIKTNTPFRVSCHLVCSSLLQICARQRCQRTHQTEAHYGFYSRDCF